MKFSKSKNIFLYNINRENPKVSNRKLFQILEILNFLYFESAKYGSILRKWFTFKYLQESIHLYSSILLIERDDLDNLKTIKFKEEFVSTPLYPNLKGIINK
ncbi:hypothetical protein H312_00012 [Anncaliia algerae PRA339]|uniref:Uncharacterized protein n=1 Tax=Anncaliia algerae PRA339 TaxID=1288291 RepID=A0A059F5S3_9MICR|nr:hypothetical protein H312_00012 [Anncaliia algerae PRA339]